MSYWFLGSPYSKYIGGIDGAHTRVCYDAGLLVACGVLVYSPIAHYHSIATISKLDPLDYKIWLIQNAPMIAAAKGMIVLKLPGWETSYGLTREIEEFRSAGKPVVYMEPGIVPEELL